MSLLKTWIKGVVYTRVKCHMTVNNIIPKRYS